MYKKSIIWIILVFSIITLTGCNQSITYSDKFEGIPIYPKTELIDYTEYQESYEKMNFKDTFKVVKEFYMETIDKEKWEIEENHMYPSLQGEDIKSEGYILKSGEQEVSLIIGLHKTKNKGDILRIELNGSPFKEDKYTVEGKSENWKTSLQYIIRKGSILVNGHVEYTGDNSPKEVYYKFLIYEIKSDSITDKNMVSKNSSQEVQGEQLKNDRFDVSSLSNREYQLEVYKKAINLGYIEIKWDEKGEDKIEKINIEIVE